MELGDLKDKVEMGMAADYQKERLLGEEYRSARELALVAEELALVE